MFLCRSIAGVLLAALTALPALAATYGVEQGVCPFKEKSWFNAGEMDCATVVAREAGAAEAYRLPVLRLKRTDAASRAAPVVFVNGGPGGRGVTEVGDWLAHPLRKRHDIILYDTRGTGKATPEPCPGLADRLLDVIGRDLDAAGALAARRALVRECVASVPPERRGDYSADALADDLAAVGRMFGYQRLNLYAVSYGTRIAANYARRYPQALERVLLDSLVPTGPYYDAIADNFTQALDRAFLQCERDAACNARYPRFRLDYHAVMAKLAARPLRLAAQQAGAADIYIDDHDFALLVQQLMYGKDFIPVLPVLFANVLKGDNGAVGVLYAYAIGMHVRSLNFGVYYLALLSDEPQRSAGRAGLAPHDDELLFFRHDMEALAGLAGAGPSAPAPTRPPGFAGPVQVVAGSLDPITAPRYGRALAAQGNGAQSNVRYTEVAGVGHTPTLAAACAGPAVAAFFAGGEFTIAPGCFAGATPGYWTGDLYPAAWPRSLIESVFVSRSLLPLAGFAAVLVLYCGFIGWGAVRLLRRRTTDMPAQPNTDRRLRLAAQVGIASAALSLLGICLVVGKTIAGFAPTLIVFGLVTGTPVIAGIAGLILLSLACSLFVATALVRRRLNGKAAGAAARPRWILVGMCVNFCVFGLMLQWMVLEFVAG